MDEYTTSPDVSDIRLSDELMADVETIARSVHDEWQRQRNKKGWGYDDNGEKKTSHPTMVPYEDLPEVEKDIDRATVLQTIRMLHYLGYTVQKQDRTIR